MNETFPATPISVETFAQRLIALDTLRHAIVDLWDFAVRMAHPTGWDARDVLRLEEIRHLVEAERPLLAASRATALEYKEFLRNRGIYPALPPIPLGETVSPREKSTDQDEHSTSAHFPIPSTSNPFSPAPNAEKRDRFAPRFTDPIASLTTVSPEYQKLSAGRSADAPRKADAKIRSRGKNGRRRRRARGAAGRQDPRRRKGDRGAGLAKPAKTDGKPGRK
jgi:hypothetical protein